MRMREITATPAQLIVEQLAASGVRYVFNNSGSREASFFDALHEHPDIHGILALHEGSVTAMASGYTQVNFDPAVSLVHLGAGLAQSLGQLINTWQGSLPVVVLTFAGDTGSYADRMGLDLSHDFGPTAISAPFTKAGWSVMEPDHLPHAVERALRAAKTPPMGPVHLAVYDRILDMGPIRAQIADGPIPDLRAGHPDQDDVEALTRALHDSKRPMIYAGDGVSKSGARSALSAVAEHFGAPDRRRLPAERPLFTPAELRPVSGGRASGRPGLRHRRRRTTPRTVVAERLRAVRRRRAHSRHRPRLQEPARHPGYRPRHPG